LCAKNASQGDEVKATKITDKIKCFKEYFIVHFIAQSAINVAEVRYHWKGFILTPKEQWIIP
jgi:hypothetical protein